MLENNLYAENREKTIARAKAALPKRPVQAEQAKQSNRPEQLDQLERSEQLEQARQSAQNGGEQTNNVEQDNLSESVLTFTSEASNNLEAFPLGNGRLGVMIFGGLDKETISLNEDSFWSGYPEAYKDNPIYGGEFSKGAQAKHRAEKWQLAKEKINSGDNHTANKLLQEYFTGPCTECYLPVGEISIEISRKQSESAKAGETQYAQPELNTDKQAESYCRQLDFEQAVFRQTAKVNGFQERREAFVSHDEMALFYRLQTDNPEGLKIRVSQSTQVKDLSLDPELWRQEDRESLGELAKFRQGLEQNFGPKQQVMYKYYQAPNICLPPYIDASPEKAVVYSEADNKRGMVLASFIYLIDLAEPLDSNNTDSAASKTCSLSADSAPAQELCMESRDILLIWTARTSFAGPNLQPFCAGKPVISALLKQLTDLSTKFNGSETDNLAAQNTQNVQNARNAQNTQNKNDKINHEFSDKANHKIRQNVYQHIFRAHCRDYQQFYQRVTWQADASAYSRSAENVALRRLFNFDRYLLISSSRENRSQLIYRVCGIGSCVHLGVVTIP